jgi:hypothetical protein
MHEEEFEALIAQMAALMEQSRQRDARMEQRQDAHAQQLSELFDQKVDRFLLTVSGQTSGAVREGLGPPTDDYQRRVGELTAEAGQTTQVLKATRADVASQRRLMWWGMGAVLLVSVASLVVNYQMLYGQYRQEYEQLLTAVPYLDAVNRSDVVPCGDGQLCVRVDDKSPRYGDKKQYRVVAPRK